MKTLLLIYGTLITTLFAYGSFTGLSLWSSPKLWGRSGGAGYAQHK